MKLDPKWEPLTHVVERYYNTKCYWAIGPYVVVSDLDKWKKQKPALSYSDLLHERCHSLHQKEMGLAVYTYKYATDLSFRRKEERFAYYVEIRYLVQEKIDIDIEHYAKALSGPVYGNMMDYISAKQWAKNVIAEKHKSIKSNPNIPKKYLVD